METAPKFNLEDQEVHNHLDQIIDLGQCGGTRYAFFWLTGGDFKADYSDNDYQPAIFESSAMYYPNEKHPLGGHLISISPQSSERIQGMKDVEIYSVHLADDTARYGATRDKLADSVKNKGGLLSVVSKNCQIQQIPLGVITLWLENETDPKPTLASLYSVAVLPPKLALNAIKFAIWQRLNEKMKG